MKTKRTSFNFLVKDEKNNDEINLRIDKYFDVLIDKYFDVFISYKGNEIYVPEEDFFQILKEYKRK
jgi:hypothetical protein